MSKELKDAYVQNLIYKLRDIKSELKEDSDMWYGGLPPLLHQMENFIDGHIMQLTSVFDVKNEDKPQTE